MSKLKGWKTYLFNLLLMATAVIGFLEQSSGTIQEIKLEVIVVKKFRV